MTPQPILRTTSRDHALGWSAFGAAALAVFAWAACCVLLLTLSIAGQRIWLTVAAGVVLAGGWWIVWRRKKVCALDPTCPLPSPLLTGLLSAATVLMVLAVVWPSLIEPWLLALLRTARR